MQLARRITKHSQTPAENILGRNLITRKDVRRGGGGGGTPAFMGNATVVHQRSRRQEWVMAVKTLTI